MRAHAKLSARHKVCAANARDGPARCVHDVAERGDDVSIDGTENTGVRVDSIPPQRDVSKTFGCLVGSGGCRTRGLVSSTMRITSCSSTSRTGWPSRSRTSSRGRENGDAVDPPTRRRAKHGAESEHLANVICGDVDEGYGKVADVFLRNPSSGQEVGVAVTVYRDGRKVVDLWGGHCQLEKAAHRLPALTPPQHRGPSHRGHPNPHGRPGPKLLRRAPPSRRFVPGSGAQIETAHQPCRVQPIES